MDEMLDGQGWLPIELLNIGLAAALFFACLAVSMWKAMFDVSHRLYWRLTAGLLWSGIIIAAFSSGDIDRLSVVEVFGWALASVGIVSTLARTSIALYRQSHGCPPTR